MRLIDADAALEVIRTLQTYKLFAGDDMVLIDKAEAQTELMMLPSAEPEPSQVARDIATILENEKDMRVIATQSEIVRCKDCKHSRFFDPCFYCYEMGGEVIVPENGFCFKAERREK